MKKVLKVFAWVLCVLVVLLLASPLWLGPLAKCIANSVVPGIVGTKFNVQSISVNVYSGRLTVEGVTLANPEGFKDAENAVTLGRLKVELDLLSALGDVIHVDEILVEDPYVSYVFNDSKNNFEVIADNVAGDEKKEEVKEEEKKEKDEGGKKVIIDKLTVSGLKVKYRMLPAIPIFTITLNDIGKADATKGNVEGGASFEQVKETIWEQVQKGMSSAGGALGDLLKGTGGVASDAAGAAVGVAADAAGTAAGAAAAAAGAAAGAANDAVKGVGNAVKGLFGGDKK